jgi:hypothetical protein
MVLALHVLIALGSLIYTTYLYLRPTTAMFKPAYALLAATLTSGTYLVWSSKAPLLQACTTGLLYLSIVTVGIALAHKKLSEFKDNT